MKKLLTALFLTLTFNTFAQSVHFDTHNIEWADSPIFYYEYPDTDTEVPTFNIYRFKGASFNTNAPSLPIYSVTFNAPSYGNLRVQLSNEVWENFDKEPSQDDAFISENINFNTLLSKERLQYKGAVSFIPIRKSNSGFERLVSFDLSVNLRPEAYPISNAGRDEYPTVSVLADADENPVFKIPVTSTGIYKLNKEYLENLGINTAEINPRNIKIYGNGGGALAEPIDISRYNDLIENPIKVIGESDGVFNTNDAVIFYAEGPHKWLFDSQNQLFERKTNVYANTNYYFLKIDDSPGLRVSDTPLPNQNGADYTTSEFSDFRTYEEERQNLLDKYTSGYAGGQRWFGASYKLQREQSIEDYFSFPNITNTAAHIKAEFAARSNVNSTLNLAIDGNTFSASAGSVTLGNDNGKYAKIATISATYNPVSSTPTITLNYPSVGNSEGWLDYVTINARRQLKMTGNAMAFQDIQSFGATISRFNLSDATTDTEIWDISNPIKPALQNTNNSNGQISFGTGTSDILRRFVAFKTNGDLPQPAAGSALSAQNLHGFSETDMLIVYHPNFKSQAEQLAAHRADFNNFNVALASTTEVYNEFSSGKKDPGAIREIGKMLFERNPDRFKYLLLFGDGSFDPRGASLNASENQISNDFVPVYETIESLSGLSTFPSDDFYGLITEGEGTESFEGLLDLSVGRIPVRTATQAQKVVEKIINYDTDIEAMGDWRNRILHVADNGDGNAHQRDNERIAEDNRELNKILNIDKIYLDAYQRVATTGDARVPEANEALNKSMFKGNLAVIYLGHGGPGGWTQERVLRKEDIFSWENKDKLPLFMTATCTFAGYDAESDVSAGEEVFLKEDGGAIGLYSTVRPVFANQNYQLTDRAAEQLFRDPTSIKEPIGEILRLAKNSFGPSFVDNRRKFQMIGDPAQALAVPKLNVTTNSIVVNEVDSPTAIDTIRALDKVTITGSILNTDGTAATDFNGILYPTVYDKLKTLQTLGQVGNPMDYNLRKNVIFKGRARVTEGQFTFTFIVPKDIDYNFGDGKISYYAEDESTGIDAAGVFRELIIGGINPNALTDEEGPLVEPFMNTWEWVSGSTTNENPTLLVRLKDDLGINVVGNSIGHDLTGILDNNSQNTYLLNDFYEAEPDDYTSGTVRFPLQDIEPGFHEIRVKAWDVANNPAEGSTEFVVAESAEVALTNVLNYPNPFVNRTCFMFDHNQAGELDVLVNIYTISGRLVKTLQERIDGGTGKVTRDNCIEWDGKDDFGDDLARGVYLYKVRLRNNDTGVLSEKEESEFERLVIIK